MYTSQDLQKSMNNQIKNIIKHAIQIHFLYHSLIVFYCSETDLSKHNCIVMRIDDDSSAHSESFTRMECTNWDYRRVRVTSSGPSTTDPLLRFRSGSNSQHKRRTDICLI